MPKVLLFGTSGNPPTGRDGHTGMIEYFVSLGGSVVNATLMILELTLQNFTRSSSGYQYGLIKRWA